MPIAKVTPVPVSIVRTGAPASARIVRPDAGSLAVRESMPLMRTSLAPVASLSIGTQEGVVPLAPPRIAVPAMQPAMTLTKAAPMPMSILRIDAATSAGIVRPRATPFEAEPPMAIAREHPMPAHAVRIDAAPTPLGPVTVTLPVWPAPADQAPEAVAHAARPRAGQPARALGPDAMVETLSLAPCVMRVHASDAASVVTGIVYVPRTASSQRCPDALGGSSLRGTPRIDGRAAPQHGRR